VDEVPIPSVEDAKNSFKIFQSIYDAPAYVRRAREVEGAYEHLLARCRRQREEWLPMVKLRLGTLRALAGGWQPLIPLLADPGQWADLDRMHGELEPKLRCPVEPTSSAKRFRRALAELRESTEQFNRRWQGFIPKVDLSHVNELREGYNRWYILEKECAMRSPRLARQGFVRLEPLTAEDLFAVLPLLPVLELVR
jgi:hypothetical protein